MTDVEDIDGNPPLGALFSTAASDNAEVVPPAAPRGPESMWSTDASPEPDATSNDDAVGRRNGSEFSSGHDEPLNGRTFADDHHDPVRPLWDRTGLVEDGPFSSEPVNRDDDVIEAGDLFEPSHDVPPEWNPPSGSASVFSSGAARSVPPRVDDSPWTVLSDDWSDEPDLTSPRVDPARAHGGPSTNGAHHYDNPPPAPPSQGWTPHPGGPAPHQNGAAPHSNGAAPHSNGAAPHSNGSAPHQNGSARHSGAVADPHGLEAAVARLAVHDQERAAVAIAVCGALLEPDELVAGIVTGQMLGRPAAVAVTDRRVIISNDRRWQPLVDVYQIDSKLVVRGRHDRQVAALSFADATRLSMIDGITEVELAIHLAECIRDTEPAD